MMCKLSVTLFIAGLSVVMPSVIILSLISVNAVVPIKGSSAQHKKAKVHISKEILDVYA
jgi:hypothetical protein